MTGGSGLSLQVECHRRRRIFRSDKMKCATATKTDRACLLDWSWKKACGGGKLASLPAPELTLGHAIKLNSQVSLQHYLRGLSITAPELLLVL
jgi:hypothetical protein